MEAVWTGGEAKTGEPYLKVCYHPSYKSPSCQCP